MELLVDRYERSNDDTATIGHLMIDGVLECVTLEDKVREIPGRPPSEWKIAGITAIGIGRYKLTWVWSPRRQCLVPLVNDVPGFSAIEVHWGNFPINTDGCLLAGKTHTEGKSEIGASRLAWDELMPKLEAAWGVERVKVASDPTFPHGLPLEYHQVGTPGEIWITYRNSLPEMVVADPEIAT